MSAQHAVAVQFVAVLHANEVRANYKRNSGKNWGGGGEIN
jgi:hypothetical protein